MLGEEIEPLRHHNHIATQRRQTLVKGLVHQAPLQGQATTSSSGTFRLPRQPLLPARAASNPSPIHRGSASAARELSHCLLLLENQPPLSPQQLETSHSPIYTYWRNTHHKMNPVHIHQAHRSARAAPQHCNSPTRLFDLTHFDRRPIHRTLSKLVVAVKPP